MADIITFKDVSKVYGKKEVLLQLNFSIKEGEIFGMLGPSGSGKTTIIKLMTSIESATSGTVTVNGIQLPSDKILSLIGYMGQADALYTDLTGVENLDFFATLYGLKGKEKRNRIDEVLALMNLEEARKKLVSNYSGGMKKRLSLAIAILHRPKLLILDEPTVGIDPRLRKEIWEAFEAMKQEGTTLVVTTHIMDEAERCERIALINEGKLVALDKVSNLVALTSNGKLEELFFEKEVAEA